MTAGILEIVTYVPAELLKHSPGEMNIDEFLEAIAMARYVQELRALEIASGIVKAFEK